MTRGINNSNIALATKTTAIDVTGVDFVSDAHESAVMRVVDMLRHPDDLTNKLPLARKKIAMERASVEAQLKTVMEAQLDGTQKGMDAIRACKVETQTIKQSLTAMDALCGDTQNTIKNYAFIRKITRTHQNFIATKSMLDQFRKINEQIDRIQMLLDQDCAKLIGPADHLLFIHHQLQELARFRNKTMKLAKGCSTDVINTLNSIFKKFENVEYKFDVYLWDLAKNTIPLIQSGYASTVVRIAKIIEVEERFDEQAARLEVHGGSNESVDMTRKATIRGYRIKFFDAIREGIQSEVKKIYDDNANNVSDLLKEADKIIDRLILIHDDVTPLFPKRYNIFHFYVLEYHRALYEMINELIGGNLDPATILLLIKWVRDYYESMSARLDVSEDLLEPRLLDGREDELTDEYIKLVRRKLTEWLANILHTETVDFLERRHPPEMDTNGQYLLTGSVIVFQMFNQQIDVVSISSRGQLLQDVVMECCTILQEFQNSWIKILDQEYARFVAKEKDLAEGVVEYTIALANDCLRSTEFAETISIRLEGLTDEQHRTTVTEQVKTSMDGFMRIVRRAQQILVDIVFADIQPALAYLHCQQWYDQDIMKLIIGTFEDYGEDFQKHMSDYLYGKVTSELLDRFLIAYLDSFRNKNAKLKAGVAVERIRSDIELAVMYFSKTKNAKRAKAAFEVIEKVVGLIDSIPRMVFLDFYSLWRAYPDVPLDFIEKILSKRDDLDKSQLKEIMETIRSKTKEEKPEEAQPTIFSKLPK